MDERAKQFKTAAEAQLCGGPLKKEIATLRRFLFRNQEYRFTKSAQQYLYMAVVAHHSNPASHHASAIVEGSDGTCGSAMQKDAEENANEDDVREGEAADTPILKLLDDTLKMPFSVFSSVQKEKLLALYWSVLGTAGGGNSSRAPVQQVLSLLDVVKSGSMVELSLFADDGAEYPQMIDISHTPHREAICEAFATGREVLITILETDSGAQFASYTVSEEE